MSQMSLDISFGKNIQKDPIFTKDVPGTGSFRLNPFSLDEDSIIIHDWVNRDYASFWQMQNTTVEEVKNTYKKILETGHSYVYIGFFNDQPSFLLECYDPGKDRLADYYEVRKGDVGMHVLVGPAKRPVKNFTWHVFTVIMDFIFENFKANRVVVEPDVRNEKIHILNKRVGFEYAKVIEFPEKKAHLAFCSRNQYQSALQVEINNSLSF